MQAGIIGAGPAPSTIDVSPLGFFLPRPPESVMKKADHVEVQKNAQHVVFRFFCPVGEGWKGRLILDEGLVFLFFCSEGQGWRGHEGVVG